MGGMAGGLFGRVIAGKAKVAATGGVEYVPGDGYKYHLFESDGNFTVTGSGLIDVYVVGGGGGRGAPAGQPPGSPNNQGTAHGAGSGGGGYTYGYQITNGVWTVDIGGAGQYTLGNQVLTPGGANGGGYGGMGRKSPTEPTQVPNFNRGGSSGGGYTRIYNGGTTIAAGGGGGGGRANQQGYGSDTATSSPQVQPTTTQGKNGNWPVAGASIGPNGAEGGGGSGGGIDGSGGGGGGGPLDASGYGGASYSNPAAISYTPYIGTDGFGPQPNTGVSAASLPTAPTSKWIPEEPLIAGRGSNACGRERNSVPYHVDAEPGYLIIRYLT